MTFSFGFSHASAPYFIRKLNNIRYFDLVYENYRAVFKAVSSYLYRVPHLSTPGVKDINR